MKNSSKAKPYIFLHLILLFNTLAGVFSKIAAGKTFFSGEWFLFYGLLILVMGIYAVLWQQALKMLPLNIAYANKAVTVIWALIWGVLFFNETITLGNIIGAAVVIAGVILMVTGGEKQHE